MIESEVTFLNIPCPFTREAYSLGYDPYNSVHALDTFCKVKWGYEGVRMEQRKGKKSSLFIPAGRALYMGGGEPYLQQMYAK